MNRNIFIHFHRYFARQKWKKNIFCHICKSARGCKYTVIEIKTLNLVPSNIADRVKQTSIHYTMFLIKVCVNIRTSKMSWAFASCQPPLNYVILERSKHGFQALLNLPQGFNFGSLVPTFSVTQIPYRIIMFCLPFRPTKIYSIIKLQCHCFRISDNVEMHFRAEKGLFTFAQTCLLRRI